MKILSSIVSTKVIASLLLMVFTFIQAEKIFHTHQESHNATHQKGITVKLVSAGCAICDFQMARNAELPILISTDLPFTYLQRGFVSSYSCYHYLPATQLSNRGPPVC